MMNRTILFFIGISLCFSSCYQKKIKEIPSVATKIEEKPSDSIVNFTYEGFRYDVPNQDIQEGRRHIFAKDSLFYRGKDTIHCKEIDRLFYTNYRGVARETYYMKDSMQGLVPFMKCEYYEYEKKRDFTYYFRKKDSIIYNIDTIKCEQLYIQYNKEGEITQKGCQNIVTDKKDSIIIPIGTWYYYSKGILSRKLYFHNDSLGKDYIIHTIYDKKGGYKEIITNNFKLYQNDSIVLSPKEIKRRVKRIELSEILTDSIRRKQLNLSLVKILSKKSGEYKMSSGNYEDCKGWNIDDNSIKHLLKYGEKIDFRDLLYTFDVYPCEVTGILSYKGVEYEYHVNAASWIEIYYKNRGIISLGYCATDALKRGFLENCHDPD